MRLLSVYLNCESSMIAKNLALYLTDAGHNVYISEKYFHTYINSGIGKHHNLFSLSPLIIKETLIDYQICFNDESETGETICPKLYIDDQNIRIEIVAETQINQQRSFFSLAKLILDRKEEQIDYETLSILITETFIDAIINLCRGIESQEQLYFTVSENNCFQDYLNYEKAYNEYYISYNHNENVNQFDLDKLNLIKNEQNYETIELINRHYKLIKKDLELVLISILHWANDFQTANYSYLVAEKDNLIQKNIVIKGNEFFQDIVIKINTIDKLVNNNLFSIIKNKLILSNSQKMALICEDKIISSSDYPVIIFANDESIQIKYQKGLHFLASIKDYAQLIIDQYSNFKKGLTEINELYHLPESYYQKILIDWNQSTKCYDSEKTLHALFEKQAAETPEKIALIFNDAQLTYHELNEKSNQLCRLLIEEYQLSENTVVAMAVTRGFDLVITLLAILKAGCAYVPIDLNYPIHRIAFLVEDSGAVLFLSNDTDKLKELSILFEGKSKPEFINLQSRDIKQKCEQYPSSNVIRYLSSSALAYVIYTSGTTGLPKGTLLEHRNVVNLIQGMISYLDFGSNEKLLAITTIGFDIAGLEIYMPLLKGAACVITADNENLDIKRLLHLIQHHKITYMQATPSLWSMILQQTKDELKEVNVLCGGESMSAILEKQFITHCKKIWNVYGPTETCIWSTAEVIDAKNTILSIGKPIANTQCYILNEDLKPVPIGIIGELAISGDGVARGYLNRDDLNKKAFIENPYQSDHFNNAVIYKTGDMALWTIEGKIVCLGRKDNQVKIRGHRIELSEIENVILSIDDIENCAVILEVINDKPILLGYYTSKKLISESEIIVQISKKLPEYMIPSHLIYLDKLPLSVNGKLDKKNLPKPEISHENIVKPQNQYQHYIASVWLEVLPLAKQSLSIHDDFFELGGNSIAAIQLVNRINTEFNSDINISDIFLLRTISQIANKVEISVGQFIYQGYMISTSDQKKLFAPFPLTSVQQTYYLGRFDSFELSGVSTHIYTEYHYKYINVEKLEKAFNACLVRHPALRTVFSDESQRFIEKFDYYKIAYHEINTETELLTFRNCLSHKLYSPDVYPLFDIVVCKLKESYILIISFDAIIIDMSSFQILFKEWIRQYNNPCELEPLPISFRDYVIKYNELRESELYDIAKNYWLKKVDDYCFDMQLPLKVNPASISKPVFKRITKTIDKSVWNKILHQSNRLGISATVIILEIYARVISFWSGQNQVTINLTLFNRLPLHKAVENLLGDFTVLSLVNYQTNNTISFQEKLKLSHQQILEDIKHNLCDGIDFQRLIKANRKLETNQILAPIVLTSVLGLNQDQASLFNLPFDDNYLGIGYSISQTAQVWLDNKAYETNEGFIAEWDYVEDLFSPELIQNMHELYCQLIEDVAVMDWSVTKVLPIDQTNKIFNIIDEKNDNKINYPIETIHQTYQDHIKKYQCYDSNAVIDVEKNRVITHRQLLNDSELLAKILCHKNKDLTSSNTLIAVFSEKGYNQVLACLSILKSGHAYLPLHVDWPIGRIKDVLEQGDVKICLISRKMYLEDAIKSELSKCYELIVIEDFIEDILTNNMRFDLEKINLPRISPSAIAYVIFTSGSTGKPKGVTITHESAMNTIMAVNHRFEISNDDTVLALSELSFDLSVYDLFGLLLAGGTIVFPEQQLTKEPEHWLSLIKTYQITIWNTVPQLAGLLVDAAEYATLASIRVYLLSGDWIPLSLPAKLNAHSPSAILMGLGGATEGSIWSIWYEINAVDSSWKSIPYGTAMPNQTMHVLNADLETCPPGVKGEIYIGGCGVALNYWNAPELTAERFIEHHKFGRIYKTGDDGKWSEEGYIEFLGRRDFQVKLNGYRVELEEITNQIKQLPGVLETMTRLQLTDKGAYILSYIIAKNKKINKVELQLSQLGLINNLTCQYSIEIKPDPTLWALRKSYRKFNSKLISPTKIVTAYEIILHKLDNYFAFNGTEMIDSDKLFSALSVLSGITLPGRALPKYRYPSGGSSYALRCFVYLENNMHDIESGFYYFHPVLRELQRYPENDFNVIDQKEGNRFYFVAHWPAIKSMYGSHSDKLVKLEFGHMIGLIAETLQSMNLSYSVQITDNNINEDNTLIGMINLSNHKNHEKSGEFTYSLDMYDAASKSYRNLNDELILSAQADDIFKQCSANTSLLNSGQAILSLRGENTNINLISAGVLFQRLSEMLIEFDIGTTTLGMSVYSDNIYSMIFGSIDAEEKIQPSSEIPEREILSVINEFLSPVLPQYMLPHHVFVLDKFPLSSNGKLDESQLPTLMMDKTIHVLTDEAERKIAQIFSTVLNIDMLTISAQDNFFRLGGNSLIAMRLVRELKQELDFKVTLPELYKNNTVSLLALAYKENLNEREIEREEGVL